MESVLLFNKYDLMSVLENQKGKVSETVSAVTSQKILETNIDELISNLVEELSVDPINLLEDEINVEQEEAKVDGRWNSMRFISDRSKPFYIDGIKVTYFLPFTGDPELLKCRPNQFTFNPPRVTRIDKNELVFEFSFTDGNIANTKTAFNKSLSDLKQWVKWINDQVNQYNQDLIAPIRSKILSRQQTIQQSQQQIGDLGFKVRPKKAVIKEETISAEKLTNRKHVTKNNNEFPTYDVALSFAGENRIYVEEVATLLKNKGIRVFYDSFEKVNLWGRNLIDHLGKVYAEQSRFIVMFISENYAVKQWPNHERKFAQDRAFKMGEDCILPARFDDTEIAGSPSSIGYIDLRRTSPEELADLIEQKLKD